MPVSLAGFVKYRKHQFGRQTDFGTAVAAKRRYGFKGVPAYDPKWTDPDIDVGSVDIVAAPYRDAPDQTSSLTEPALRYNTLPLILAAFFGNGVTPTGSGDSKSWHFVPDSDTPDVQDVFTYEFTDDVTDDAWQFRDGFLESFEISGPEGLGALTASMNWRFGAARNAGSTDFPPDGSVPTTLTFDANQAIVFLKDIGIYLASARADLSSGQITDALHSFTLRGTATRDQKRFANGDNSFDMDAVGTADRMIELECSWMKSSDIVGTGSESDAWMSDKAVDRYVEIKATSTDIAETGSPDIPYSADLVMPMRYYTRTEGEQGGNSLVVLTGKAFYDGTSVFDGTVVNTVANADL